MIKENTSSGKYWHIWLSWICEGAARHTCRGSSSYCWEVRKLIKQFLLKRNSHKEQRDKPILETMELQWMDISYDTYSDLTLKPWVKYPLIEAFKADSMVLMVKMMDLNNTALKQSRESRFFVNISNLNMK